MCEITINIPASTKASEVCLHAASHLNSELKADHHVDGATLEARDKDGHIFNRQDNISKAISGGETIFMMVSTQANLQLPYERPSPDTFNPDLTSNASLTPNPQPPPTAREDQVPPPRKLPFAPRPGTGTVENTVQLLASSRSPLDEHQNLVNRNSPKGLQEVSPPLSMNGNTNKVAGKKRPESRQATSRQSRRLPKAVLRDNLESQELDKPATPIMPLGVMTRSATTQSTKVKETGEHQQAEMVPAGTAAITADAEPSIEVLAGSSCMGCRRKKFRCDRVMPQCGRCAQGDRKCNYPSTKPKSVTIENKEGTVNVENLDHLITSGSQPPSLGPVMRHIATQASATPVMQDATTQVLARSQDLAVQTEEVEEASKDVEMVDAATHTSTAYTNTAVETARSDDIWLPHSQSFMLMSWAKDRYGEQLKKAADVLRTADPSNEDYRQKVYLAAQYGLEFEMELREMCEKSLQGC